MDSSEPQKGWAVELSPEMLGPLHDEHSPVASALDYIDALAHHRTEDAWAATSARFRLRLARHWAWGRRFELGEAGWHVQQLIDDLADIGSEHPMWPTFARLQQEAVTRMALPGREGWVSVGPAELVGVGLEMVVFAAPDNPRNDRLALMMRWEEDAWKVVGLVVK